MKNSLILEQMSTDLLLARFDALEELILKNRGESAPAPAPVGYLTRQAVAELLGVSLVTVTDWTNKGFLKSYRLGNRVYFKAAEIDAAMLEIPAGKRRAAA